jgi:predicted DCC family thiol-disulfide oxidoreductase YuxK
MQHLGFEAELIGSNGIILFDGRCAFCRNVVGRLLRDCTGARLQVCSTRSQRGDAAVKALGLNPANTFAFVTRDGVFVGVQAYVKILALGPRWSRLSKLVALTPPTVSGSVYHWIASHRPLMSRLLGRGSRDAIPLNRFVVGGT